MRGCLAFVLVLCLLVFGWPLLWLCVAAGAFLLETALWLAPLALLILVIVWIFSAIMGG